MGGSKFFAASQKDDESCLDGSNLEEVVFDYNNYCYFNVIFQTIKVMNDFKKWVLAGPCGNQRGDSRPENQPWNGHKYWAQAASKLLAVIRRNLFQTPRPPLRHKNITAGHTGRHRAGQQRTPGTRPATRPANLVLVTDPNLMRLMLNISHSKL